MATQYPTASDTFMEVNGHLHGESERGCVILGAAFIDDALTEMIRGRLVASPERTDELLEGSNAPISTFSARIDLAYRLGMLEIETRQSLHVLRRLRNDFAHVANTIDLSDASVRDRIKHLLSLNRNMLEKVWVEMRPKILATPGIPLIENDDHLEEFFQTAGTRTTFVTCIAMIATGLRHWGCEYPRFSSRNDEDA